jgi:glycosyltransferase involved in cell wall biosynthesis
VDVIIALEQAHEMQGRALNITYVIGGLDAGGAERQLHYLVTSLRRSTNITVVSLSMTATHLLPRFRELSDIETVVLPKARGLDVTLIPRLISLFHHKRPTIVHTFLRTANYWGRVAACLARVPIVISSERNLELERGRTANILDGLLSQVSDRVIVNANAVKTYLVNSEGLSPSKIEVIYNGVPILTRPSPHARTVLRSELGINDDSVAVAFIGRLFRQKNPELFIEAADLLTQKGAPCKWFIIGDGELGKLLQAEVRRRGLETVVRFLGLRNDVQALLPAMDVLALTSDWEGMPNVVLEALAAGVPVVATDVGGVSEVVTDGVTGYVVSPRNVLALADRISLLVQDEGLRRTMGSRGAEVMRQQFAVEQMAERTLTLYRSLLRVKGLHEFLGRPETK